MRFCILTKRLPVIENLCELLPPSVGFYRLNGEILTVCIRFGKESPLLHFPPLAGNPPVTLGFLARQNISMSLAALTPR